MLNRVQAAPSFRHEQLSVILQRMQTRWDVPFVGGLAQILDAVATALREEMT
jgi:hypothetical protein